MFKKLPLAWLQLIHEKTRLLTAIAGIAFADILMFIQIGFKDALYISATGPHYSIQGDLVIVEKKYKTIFYIQNFSRKYLYQMLGVAGVKNISSLYIGSATWINPQNLNSRVILAFGIEPEKPSLNFPEVNQNLAQLKQLNTIFFDQASRPEYGEVAKTLQAKQNFEVEINEIRVKVKGLFALGASFSAEGNFITSDLTFCRIFERDSDKIEVGVIKLNPDVDPVIMRPYLQQKLPPHLQILTIEEFAEIEKDYWENSTGIGFIFSLGALMGFIVGAVIVYQILYSDVADHLPEYATMKAMGYSDRYLLMVLAQESLILSCFGYIPGFFIAWAMYDLTRNSTMLPIFMTLNCAILVFILTLIMCTISAAIAIRKLQEADPADIF
jgi:putative ABC transport system permease protein